MVAAGFRHVVAAFWGGWKINYDFCLRLASQWASEVLNRWYINNNVGHCEWGRQGLANQAE